MSATMFVTVSGLRMPRACPVGPHAGCYTRRLRDGVGCHGLAPWSLTLVVLISMAVGLLVDLCSGAAGATTPQEKQTPPTTSDSDDGAKTAALEQMYKRDAGEYEIHLEGKRDKKLQLRPEPVYTWTNPTRNDGQH